MTAPKSPLIRMAEEVEKCGVCGGDGWLWGYELPGNKDHVTDTRYECPYCERGRSRARLLRAADAVIENAGPMAWLLVAEADAHYRTALRAAIAAYRAAEKEVQGHDGD